MVPNSTWLVEAWSVVHVTIAEVVVILDAVTEVITGAEEANAAVVENVKFADVASVPTEFLDRAA